MRSKTVLVAGYDESLRRVLIEVLARAGYRVRSAADAASALDLIRDARVDLLICNAEFAQGSGVGFGLLAQQLAPDLKVLLTAGCPGGESEGYDERLRPEQLVAEVRAILGNPAGEPEA